MTSLKTVGLSAFSEKKYPDVEPAALFPRVADLATAAERLAQYKRLIGPCRMTVEHPEGELLLTFRPVGRAAFPPQYGAMEVTFWTHFARMGTRTELRPMEVQLPFELEAPEPFQDFFGVEVRRGLRPAIRFTELDARRPFLTHDEGMWSFFEPELRRRLTDVRDDATMAERVQAVLLELLPSGRTGMADVARSLGLSTRTLQRRLQRDGTRFQDVLATTRAELAHHYLSRSNMGGAEISFLLGYDDPNSFVRAFHQWTGQTPEGRRAELRAASYARQGG